MELSNPKIKKFRILYNRGLKNFSLRKIFYTFFQKKSALKKILIFQEMELFSLKLKKRLIFQEGTCKA